MLGGLGSYAVISFGFLGAESADLRWAFTTRVALLLLVVPLLSLLGRPLDLAYAALPAAGGGGRPRGSCRSRPVQLLGNAIVAPGRRLRALLRVPHPAGRRLADQPARRGGHRARCCRCSGCSSCCPSRPTPGLRSEVFIAAEFLFAFLELVLDSIPGLVLRLTGHVLDGVGAVAGAVPGWFPRPLTDQHWSGDLLWSIAEVADLPILLVLFVRWVRSDRHHADRADGLSEDELDAAGADHLRAAADAR